MQPEPEYGTTLKQRVQSDDSLTHILPALVGTEQKSFRDGFLFESTIQALNAVWTRLDFVHDGVLRGSDFQNLQNMHPFWEELLDACDVDGDGNITPPKFVAGFVMAALDKTMTVRIGEQVTGLEVMKSVAIMLNEHIMEEIAIVKQKMGWF